MAKSKSPEAGTIAEAMTEPFVSIIKTLIEVQGESHPWQDMEKDGMLPVLTSIGFARVSENSNSFVSYLIETQAGKVISMTVSEPMDRTGAIVGAKISFEDNIVGRLGF